MHKVNQNIICSKIPIECDCGKLEAMILKPNEIKYEKIATNITRFKRKIKSVVNKSIEKVKRLRKKQGNNSSNVNLIYRYI